MSPHTDRPAAVVIAVASLAVVAACEHGDTEPDVSSIGDDTADTEPDVSSIGDDTADPEPDAGSDQRFPDVLAVVATFDDAAGTWTFEVTMSSPYDSPTRYADGWRVVGPDGTVYGVHTLAHDHANEQPFTRRQTGVTIPSDVVRVSVEGRDLANGFGGETVTVSVGSR